MYGKALREVNEVLENMDLKYMQMISPEFMKMMMENIDWNYNFNYDNTKSLEEQNLSEDAKAILSIIYLKYFSNPDEKNEIIAQMNKNDKEYEKQKEILYNPNKIFEKNNDKQNKNEEKSILVIQEKWYKKIFNKIKEFFRR